MPLETLQLLVSATVRHGATENLLPLTKAGTPVKPTHIKHPSTLWVGNTRSNFKWLLRHGKAICEEYTKAYGKIHFCQAGIQQMESLSHMIPEGPLAEFAVAISPQALCRKLPHFNALSPVEKYRQYYQHDKAHILNWKNRIKPDWL